MLFKKRVVCTKLDIYVFITIMKCDTVNDITKGQLHCHV